MNSINGKSVEDREYSKSQKEKADEKIRLMWARIAKELREQKKTLYMLAMDYDFAPSPVYQNIKETTEYFEKKRAKKLTGFEKEPVDTSVYVLCSLAKALKKPLDYFFYDNYTTVRKDREEKNLEDVIELIENNSISPTEKLTNLLNYLTDKQKENIRLHILSYFD